MPPLQQLHRRYVFARRFFKRDHSRPASVQCVQSRLNALNADLAVEGAFV